MSQTYFLQQKVNVSLLSNASWGAEMTQAYKYTQWQGPIVWLPGNELTAVDHNNPFSINQL